MPLGFQRGWMTEIVANAPLALIYGCVLVDSRTSPFFSRGSLQPSVREHRSAGVSLGLPAAFFLYFIWLSPCRSHG